MKNVTTEIKDACTFCGSCVAVCPFKSLKPRHEKIILDGKCTSCGLCMAVCPAKKFCYGAIDKKLFTTSVTHHRPELGNYLEIGVAYASDNNIRNNSSSGGVVSSLLIFLLRTKIVDGVVCIRMNPDKPWQPQPFIAKTPEEVLAAQGSKYCLVQTNMILRTLNEAKNKNKRFAFVGLPCQVQGLRKMQQQGLCKNVSLVIGLFCGWNMSYKGTEYILDKFSIDKKNVTQLKYRAGKWPGGFFVGTNGYDKTDIAHNSKGITLEKSAYDFPNMMFIPKRCIVCSDYMSEYADISVGDCWINGYKSSSSVLLRTALGEDIYKRAVDSGVICHAPINANALIKSHLHNIKFKRSAHIRGRFEYGRGAIEYNLNNYNFNASASKSLVFYFILKMIRTDLFRTLAPFWMLRRIAKLRRAIKGK